MMKILAPFFPIIKKFKLFFSLGVFLIAVGTVIEIVLPIVLGKAVDKLTSGANKSELFQLARIFFALIAVRAVSETLQAYVIQRTGQKVLHETRQLVFEKILNLRISYFDQNSTGRLMTRLMNDIKSVSELFSASISVLLLDTAVIIGTIVAMLYVSVSLTIAILITFPIAVYLIFYFGKKLSEAYRVVRKHLAEINSFMGENVAAIASVQRLNAQTQREEKFEGLVGKHTKAQFESVKVFALSQPVIGMFNGISIASLLGLGGYWVLEGKVTLGIIVTFLGYIRNLFQPIRDLIEKYNTFLSSFVSLERITQILNEPDESVLTGEKQVVVLEHELEFKNVFFKYPTRETNALTEINFTLSKGKKIAIVGPTGSGKSSLIRLILKFYEPTSGEILLDGKSISEMDLKQYRKLFGFVPQEVYVFHGSIRENLTLGREKEDKLLIDIANSSGLWDVISTRGGLDFEVMEGGTNLSMGERQLLCLTRVLVLNPAVIVFDEATSNIDSILEAKLVNAIEKSMQGRSSIIIAHRLSTIMQCDEILVMECGQIIERGGYSELRQKGGLFTKFCRIYEGNTQPT